MKRYSLIFILLLFIGAIIIEPSAVYSDTNQLSENIEIYRKGNILLRCFNQDEKLPLPNCKITLTQINHDFLFYGCPMGWHGYDARYMNLLKEAGMNSSNITSGWYGIEPEPYNFNLESVNSYQNIDEQIANGFKLLGGLTLWWYRYGGLGKYFCPSYLDDMNFDELKAVTNNHMYELVNRYKGEIDYWELNEQNASWTNPLDLTWRQKLEICKAATLGIKKANAEAKIIYTANALPSEFNWPTSVDLDDKAMGVQFPEFLQMIIDYGLPFDAIGLEFYYAGKNTDGYIPPALDIEDLSDLIDLYSQFNKPISIRELLAPSEQVEGTSGWQGRDWDEDLQAEYLEQVYTMAFSKLLVKIIGWSFGVSDVDSYIISGGLLDENLNPKPSYYALKNLINSWTTSGDCITDERGECIFRGFAGDYMATITTPSGYNLDANVHIYEQRTIVTTITTGTTGTSVTTDSGVYINGTVKYNGNPLCAVILANGQYMFSCDPDGEYQLSVPLDPNGEITLFAFVDGLAPFKQTLTPSEALDFDIEMELANPESKTPTVTRTEPENVDNPPGWVKIAGSVSLNGTPLNAMVLANGQYMFSSGDKLPVGDYELVVPLDQGAMITLFVFVDGLQPYKEIIRP
ncbi:endo-1,4-beta-xylanase [Thermodesulfobacteriota bacterium]